MKTIIKVHTNIGRTKLYDVETYIETTIALVINGINLSHDNLIGKFVFPMSSIEHYNIYTVPDDFNITLLRWGNNDYFWCCNRI